MLEPLTAETLAQHDFVAHGFFTRRGGVSQGIYESLNGGVGSRDAPDAVRENRARIARHLGVAPERLLSPYQIHSDQALIVDRPWPPGERPRADALITRTPGLAIAVSTADCAPVLLLDPVARVIGAAHAGWKGALGGILEATLAGMEGLGARRKDIIAAIGPAISQQNYEVGPEFEAAFRDRSDSYSAFFNRPDGSQRPHFNLPGFIEERLRLAGLNHIEQLGLCTYENESILFSYRRACHRKEPDYGRQITAILLK